MDDYRGVMIKKGTKLRVSFLKEGVTNGKKWQFFIFNNTKKEFDKDTFVAIQRYTVFIENPRENLRDGDFVEIEEIVAVQPVINTRNGVVYRNINLSLKIVDREKTQAEKDAEDVFNSGGYVNDFDFQF